MRIHVYEFMMYLMCVRVCDSVSNDHVLGVQEWLSACLCPFSLLARFTLGFEWYLVLSYLP